MSNKREAAWDEMFAYAKQYYLEYGNLEVPQKYKTADGHNLGVWVHTQRKIYKGTLNRKKPTLNSERIAMLEEIGMIWDDIKELTWQKYYEAAKAYYNDNGNLNVPRYYVTQEGLKLGVWISTQRSYKSGAIKKYGLTPDRIAKLEEIGIAWEVIDSWWEENFKVAKEYYKENGHLNVPAHYVTPNGVPLGTWLFHQRNLKSGKAKGTPLTKEQIDRLNSIGIVWEAHRDAEWEKYYSAAEEYYLRKEDLNVPFRYVTASGIRLGAWVHRQRLVRRGTAHGVPLTEEQIKRLNKIGMIWTRLK